MDTTLPELDPGIKPAYRPVRGEAYPVSVKEKAGTPQFHENVPAHLYSIGISSIAKFSHLYSGGRVWAEPTERFPSANA